MFVSISIGKHDFVCMYVCCVVKVLCSQTMLTSIDSLLLTKTGGAEKDRNAKVKSGGRVTRKTRNR